jgi:hypothetical protein
MNGHADSDLIAWTYQAGGWIRFKADRVMDWGKQIGQTT